MKGWLSDIDRYAQGNIKVQKMLVGNKSDLPNREVSFKEAKVCVSVSSFFIFQIR